ncbi:GcrA family cell cycle regulator [Sinorhizobium americanum]|uniref:GcrA cell cycle regulator n=1 Tax=Sinorhizobium americanum TaxID=194963 RepID=A0A4R2BW96_9HYPH|nr:GcrA family cell cycle regulator [Sinorhizobium americanum]TCN30314.1 GcrA cell cycle regulator [Sinorhizobium americanum]
MAEGFWTDERIAELRKLWKDGWSASAIAREMGSSRNAVLGKAHRLHLDDRSKKALKPQAAPRERAPAFPLRRRAALAAPQPAAPQPAAPPACVETLPRVDPALRPEPLLKRIIDRDWRAHGECRWPVDGEGADTRFCCAPAGAESSYCSYHRQLARGTGTASERNVAPLPVFSPRTKRSAA